MVRCFWTSVIIAHGYVTWLWSLTLTEQCGRSDREHPQEEMGEELEPVRVCSSFVELALMGERRLQLEGNVESREGFVRCLMY